MENMDQPDLFDFAAGRSAEEDSHAYQSLLFPDDLFSVSDSSENGYERWRAENAERLRAISLKWNVPVCQRARIRLVWLDDDIEGFVEPVEWPETLGKGNLPSLKMRIFPDGKDFALGKREEIEFTSNDVVSFHVMESDSE